MRRPLNTMLISALSVGLFAVTTPTAQPTHAETPIAVLLDGQPLLLNPAPINIEGRNLVPLRAVSEAMGATVGWDGAAQTITVTKGDHFLRLRLDRRLACLERDCTRSLTLDQTPRSVNERTFVPVRLLTEALGVGVEWDGDHRAVLIHTTQPPSGYPTPVSIPTVTPGQVIDGPLSLRAQGPAGSQVRFYLINPATGTGPIIAVGADPNAAYTYTPDSLAQGARLMVAEIRDANGGQFFSHPVPVILGPNPRVELRGVTPGATIDGITELTNWVSFAATQVNWRLLNSDGSVMESLGTTGPNDSLTWYAGVGHNGARAIALSAVDRYGNHYDSVPVPINVKADPRTVVYGLKDAATIRGPLAMSVSTNYPVEYVEYFLDGAHYGWGFAQNWQVTQAENGSHTWGIEIGAKGGTVRTLGPYQVTVNVTPTVWMSGVGPDQVVTGGVSLRAGSNFATSGAEFLLTDGSSGQTTTLGRIGTGGSLSWTPPHDGAYSLQARVSTAAGALLTQKVDFKAYLGQLYTPRPVIAKSQFLGTASQLGVAAYERTGMSAAIQVAQAILESGWGQSVPVDKYTGQMSYNLFGIKGTGPAGSVVHSTWEEYSGVSYRVDANFRAYHSLEESWNDHKSFLLVRSYYVPFRAVMADPVLGAWGLKKSGYATDSAYPGKLIRLMNDYNLYALDELPL